jgi:hypothetical protein
VTDENMANRNQDSPQLTIGDFVCPHCYHIGPFGAVWQFEMTYRTRVDFYKNGKEPKRGADGPDAVAEATLVGDDIVAIETQAYQKNSIPESGCGGHGHFWCLRCGGDIDEPIYLQSGHDVFVAKQKQEEFK